MRAPQIVRDFLEWRWAPCVALTVGSLTYVGLAVLIIPSRIDGDAHAADSTTPFNAQPNTPPNTAFASSLTPNSMAGSVAAREAMRHPPPPVPAAAPAPTPQLPMDTMSLARRGFSPPIEQAEVPPPPPPPLAAAPPAPVAMQVAPPPTVGIPPPIAPQEAAVQASAAPPVPSEAALPPQPPPQPQ